jgi:O-antigen/teichoic acid export membrane protein
MKEESFLKGAYFLTAANFIVKLFGFIYVIPFVAMVGEENYILFEYAYKPYVIFISIATLGIPTAFAKYISRNRELGNYIYIQQILKSGIIFMFFSGIVSFIIMYLSAESIAKFLISENDPTGNSVNDVVFVIKMISFALLVVPMLSLLRGTLQGYKLMSPTAYSQIWEQIVRIIIILGGTYVVINLFKGSSTTAIGISTFAAFVSAIAALLVLIYYMKKADLGFKVFTKLPKTNEKINYFTMYKEIIWYAIPIVFVGLSITIFQTIDTFSINKILMMKGNNLGEAEIVNSIVALVQKIVVIPLAFSIALSISLISYITQSYEAKNNEEIRHWINKSIRVNLFFVLPSTIGLLMLSGPIYAAVFGTTYALEGGETLLFYAFAPLMFSLYSITAAILQGMNKNRILLVTLAIGIIIKLVSNYPLVLLLDGGGTAISTYMSFTIMILIQMTTIQKEAKYNWIENLSKMKSIFASNLWMAILLLPFSIIALGSSSYWENFLLVFLAVSLAFLVYMFLSYKNQSLFEVVPKHRIDKLLKKRSH